MYEHVRVAGFSMVVEEVARNQGMTGPMSNATTCQKFGHYDSDCRAPTSKVEAKANYAENKRHEDDTLLLAHKNNVGGQENAWLTWA